jgi:hypothetical protein
METGRREGGGGEGSGCIDKEGRQCEGDGWEL